MNRPFDSARLATVTGLTILLMALWTVAAHAQERRPDSDYWFGGGCTVTESGAQLTVHKDGQSFEVPGVYVSPTNGPFSLTATYPNGHVEEFAGLEFTGCEETTTTTVPTTIPPTTTTTQPPTTTTEVPETPETTTTVVETTTTFVTTTEAPETTTFVPEEPHTTGEVPEPEAPTTTQPPVETCVDDPESPTGKASSVTGRPCLASTGFTLDSALLAVLWLSGLGSLAVLGSRTLARKRG